MAALEQLPARKTHRTGPSGYAQRTGGPAAGRGSGSAGGCSSTLPGSSAWRPTWLSGAASPGPGRTEALWWGESLSSGPGSSAGLQLETSPGGRQAHSFYNLTFLG